MEIAAPQGGSFSETGRVKATDLRQVNPAGAHMEGLLVLQQQPAVPYLGVFLQHNFGDRVGKAGLLGKADVTFRQGQLGSGTGDHQHSGISDSGLVPVRGGEYQVD